MLDWLKNLGGARGFANKVGLPERSLELLGEDLAPLDELESGISQRIVAYLLDGGDDRVLTKLRSSPGAPDKLRLRCTHLSHGLDGITPRSEFFKTLDCSAPAFFRRLGQTYEAIAANAPIRISNTFKDPSLRWLEILIVESMQISLNIWPRKCRRCPAITAELLASLVTGEGRSPDVLIQAAFSPPPQRFGDPELEIAFVNLPGLGELAVRHRSALVSALDNSDFKQRAYALSMMSRCKVPLEPFLEKIVSLALDSSKQVRNQAESLLSPARETARALVERHIEEGTNEHKARAIELYCAWDRMRATEFLKGRIASEKNQRVRKVIAEHLDEVTSIIPSPSDDEISLPPLISSDAHVQLGDETRVAWQQCFQLVNEGIAKINATKSSQLHGRSMAPISTATINEAYALLCSGDRRDQYLHNSLFYASWQRDLVDPIRTFWKRPELTLEHLVRFLILVGAIRPELQHNIALISYGHWLETLLPAFRQTHPQAGLRELAAAFKALDLDPLRIGLGILNNYQEQVAPLGLPPSQVWPYWMEHLDLLQQAFAPSTDGVMARYTQRNIRRNALHALATFPRPPAPLVSTLWKLAVGPKSERTSAQKCLESLPDRTERLIETLKTGDTGTRCAAAEWLASLRDPTVIEHLKTALKKERNETAKGSIMCALEKLGLPVDQFLDRKTLLAEAEKGLAKDIPEDLKWFPFDVVPAVHWADNGRRVEPAILKWWLVQGFKLKRPEPGPLLRKYCTSIKPSEREALGQFVLEAWIGKDISPRVGAEAEAEAMKRVQATVQAAQQWAQWVQQNPQMAQQMAAFAPSQKTVQELYEEFLPKVQEEPTGSAISSKGILALAAACAGADAAPVVGRYLKRWYGMRAAQCRALIQMLVWVEHRTATQLLLSVGSRFRTKCIQEEANLQAQALAERKGWTIAELADRTIPTAGLDDDGVLALDFGPRQFTAKLNEDLDFVLTDQDGKLLKALPDPRKDDDEAKAAEARKVFAAAKKELKSVTTMQRDRFYEAMCTQRAWPYEDWSTYLNRHPIARHHCQRLVWAVMQDDKITTLFRPLADGSLTDVNDDPVTLKPDDVVGAAHECQITPEQSLAWRQHLKDYEIEPLFEQFGRPSFDLAEERKSEDELAEFRGHLLESFKLRSRANKLGYTRGQAQDGGWFYEYRKRFPTLGIEAILEFTGNSLPEENRTVALTSFRFERVVSESGSNVSGGKLSLGEVPPVLLSECWNDLRQMAAEGSGFDPEWEKKTQM